MTTEQKENLIKAANAVIKNEKKTTGQMRSMDGGRCCLCVMADELNLKSKNNPGTPDGEEFENAFGFHFREQFKIAGELSVLAGHNDGIINLKIRPKSHAEIGQVLLNYANKF